MFGFKLSATSGISSSQTSRAGLNRHRSFLHLHEPAIHACTHMHTHTHGTNTNTNPLHTDPARASAPGLGAAVRRKPTVAMSAAEDVKVRPEGGAGVVPAWPRTAPHQALGGQVASQEGAAARWRVRVCVWSCPSEGTGGEGQRWEGKEAREQKDWGVPPTRRLCR